MSGVASPGTGSSPRRAVRAARGFTLIELVLMLSILGILAMLAVPEQNVFHEVKLRSAARRLVSDLRYAQSRTMASRVVHHVIFDPVGERYAVTAPDRTTPVADPADRARALGVDYAQHGEFRGISIASVSFGGRPEVSFDTMGVPRTAAGTELAAPGKVVLSYEGLIVTVEVAPGTGKAKLR